MYIPPRDGWKNLEQAHRMGVSWPKIFMIIGGVAFIAGVSFLGAVFLGRQNSKMIEKKIEEATQEAQMNQNDVQRTIQETVNQKLREAGIDPNTVK